MGPYLSRDASPTTAHHPTAFEVRFTVDAAIGEVRLYAVQGAVKSCRDRPTHGGGVIRPLAEEPLGVIEV
jgi:hypothetical protein